MLKETTHNILVVSKGMTIWKQPAYARFIVRGRMEALNMGTSLSDCVWTTLGVHAPLPPGSECVKFGMA